MRRSCVFFKNLFLIGLLFLAVLGLASAGDRRVVDTPVSPSIRGGGNLKADKKHLLKPDNGALSSGEMLLDVGGDVERDNFSFLLEDRYKQCYVNDASGQGYSCNSCWAFAVQKMMQARRCKAVIDAGAVTGSELPLTPMNLICQLQSSTGGSNLCESQSIYDALDFAKSTGILADDWLTQWRFVF
jgi:hypothetical protein